MLLLENVEFWMLHFFAIEKGAFLSTIYVNILYLLCVLINFVLVSAFSLKNVAFFQISLRKGTLFYILAGLLWYYYSTY